MSINLIPAAKISSSGLDAERLRMETIANNLANVNSGGAVAYQRKVPVFQAAFNDELGGGPGSNLQGVSVVGVVNEDKPPIKIYSPNDPNADDKGMIYMPNISPMEEMLDLVTATRAYEANLNIMNESKKMADKTVNLFQS